MKIGLVCPYSFQRPGGVQNHVLGLAGWLKKQGHSAWGLPQGEEHRTRRDTWSPREAGSGCG